MSFLKERKKKPGKITHNNQQTTIQTLLTIILQNVEFSNIFLLILLTKSFVFLFWCQRIDENFQFIFKNFIRKDTVDIKKLGHRMFEIFCS